jgi:hypothetical protein
MPASMPASIESAESVFRELGGFPADAIPPTTAVLAAIERFGQVDFQVPDVPDADGMLFQYATLSAQNTFTIGFVRQFELTDAEGDHDCYVQLRCAYRFPPDAELGARGHREEWWFRDGPFADWFERVRTDPIWALVGQRSADGFDVSFERV